MLFSENNTPVNVIVKGLVTDSLTSETIPYSTIRVASENNLMDILIAVAADEKGNFNFTLKESGNYKLLVDYVGKKQLVQPFSIGNEKILDLGKIELADEMMLSEISVSAFKPLVKVDLDKISYSIEDDPESKTNNVLDMLKKVPLVTVDGEEI